MRLAPGRPAKPRECGFGVQPFHIFARGNQKLSRVNGPDANPRQQRRSGLVDQGGEGTFDILELFIERPDLRFYDHTGEILLEHPWPPPGTKHVSNGRPRGAGTARPKDVRDVIHSTGATAPPGEYRRTVRMDGRVSIRNVVYGIGKPHVGEELHVIVGKVTVTFWSTQPGELIAEHPIPEPGVKHVGFARYNRAPKP